MLVTVDLPIPEGYELAEPAMRSPDVGEYLMLPTGSEPLQCTAKRLYERVWILRRKWTWPKWLGDGELRFGASEWLFYNHPNRMPLPLFSDAFPEFTPPTDKTKVYRSEDYREKE